MQNRQESLDVASPGQLWFPSLDSASSDSCIVFRKSAYRLRMTVPNLSIGALLWGLQCSLQLLCCFDESDRLNAAFFFLCIDHVDSFWETQTTKSRKVSWRVFSKRQSGPTELVPGFQTCPIATLTGAEWSCARSVLASNHYYLSEFRKQTGRQ